MTDPRNALAERTRSIWMDVELPRRNALDRDLIVDVVVIGAGMAGLSTAYELTDQGLTVAVLDRGRLAGGMTSRTTAHLSWELDDYYSELTGVRSDDSAHQYADSQTAAVDRIEEIARSEGIDCDFTRIPAYLIAADKDGADLLKEEEKALKGLGRAAEPGRAPRGPAAPSLRFERQARFHPRKYLAGLVDALERRGALIFEQTPVDSIEEKDGRVIARALERIVTARYGVVATNSPVNDRVAIHTKQAPYRTYVIAGPVAKASVEDALYWDTLDPYHYVRLQPDGDKDMLIVGGEDHKAGEADDAEDRFRRLEEWTRRLFPEFETVTHAWSGMVFEPIDFLPHMGLNPGDKSIYVITGDSGQGMTSSVAGALVISQLIAKGESPWAGAYEPSRKALKAAGEYLKENLDAATHWAQHVTGGDIDGLDKLMTGCGALVRIDGNKVAAFRDEDGKVYAVSAACTHAGCVVQFNSLERCWDCPCHGSQFAIDGAVLAGPATSPLKPVQV